MYVIYVHHHYYGTMALYERIKAYFVLYVTCYKGHITWIKDNIIYPFSGIFVT